MAVPSAALRAAMTAFASALARPGCCSRYLVRARVRGGRVR